MTLSIDLCLPHVMFLLYSNVLGHIAFQLIILLFVSSIRVLSS